MPSQLINHSLKSITSGVSQQYTEARFESQVDSMTNCMPSLSRGILRRNPISTSVSFSPLPDISDAFTYTYDRGTGDEQYMLIVPGNGQWSIYNVNTGTTVSYGTDTDNYLTVSTGWTAATAFEAITIGDTTFIVNKSVKTAMDTGVSTIPDAERYGAFYWIKATTAVVTDSETSTDSVGNRLEGYEYSLTYNGVKKTTQGLRDTRASETQIDRLDANSIASNLAAISGLTSDGAFVEYLGKPTEWYGRDSFGDKASVSVWHTINDASELPANLPLTLDGFMVRVSGSTNAKDDDYWLQYSYSSKEWSERIGPSTQVSINGATMPHAFYRMTDGGFAFDTFKEVLDGDTSATGPTGGSAWAPRKAGDALTNPDPSFIGKYITSVFFHKNRLGFITGDSIILSATAEYGRFFSTTVQDVLDDDPIDLAVATTDVTVLRSAVSTSGTLLLFSDDAQFTLSSLEGPLTPSTAHISAVSNYTYNEKAKAVAIGNQIYFTNVSGGYSQLYAYRLSNSGSQITEAQPLSVHVPSFIPKTVNSIVGHDVLGYTFLQSSDVRNKITVLTTVRMNGEAVQSAFHEWTFSQDVVSLHIINDRLYILFAGHSLGGIDLDVPGNMDDVEYTDLLEGTPTPYESDFKFSEFQVRDGENRGTARGRLQLRTLLYSTTPESHFKTTVTSTDISVVPPENSFGPYWTDSTFWDDTDVWLDAQTNYARVYKDDERVTVMSNAKNVDIVFSTNEDYPTKGFELATANIEMMFHQRSGRR